MDIQYACKVGGLIGDDADTLTGKACETDDNVFGEILVYFEEGSLIDCSFDYFTDIIGLVGIGRDDTGQRGT